MCRVTRLRVPPRVTATRLGVEYAAALVGVAAGLWRGVGLIAVVEDKTVGPGRGLCVGRGVGARAGGRVATTVAGEPGAAAVGGDDGVGSAVPEHATTTASAAISAAMIALA